MCSAGQGGEPDEEPLPEPDDDEEEGRESEMETESDPIVEPEPEIPENAAPDHIPNKDSMSSSALNFCSEFIETRSIVFGLQRR